MSFTSFWLHHFSSLGHSLEGIFFWHTFTVYKEFILYLILFVLIIICVDFFSIFLWRLFLCEYNFPELCEGNLVQGSVSTFTELLWLFWGIFKNIVANLLRFPDSLPLSIFIGTSFILSLWFIVYLILIPYQQNRDSGLGIPVLVILSVHRV